VASTRAAKNRRPRRSSTEVREAILAIARKLFDEYGYEATTTLQIATEADVSERLIFSHFGTKVGLFNAAVISPFAEVIRVFIDDTISNTRNSTLDERLDQFNTGLYDLAREHRTALRTALHAGDTKNGMNHGKLFDDLARSFQTIVLAITPDAEIREDWDHSASLAAFAGTVFGVALLDDLIFPSGEPRPSRERLLEEMLKRTLVGIMRHPRPWTPQKRA
jgi:AcrR family transcriptional regulator